MRKKEKIKKVLGTKSLKKNEYLEKINDIYSWAVDGI